MLRHAITPNGTTTLAIALAVLTLSACGRERQESPSQESPSQESPSQSSEKPAHKPETESPASGASATVDATVPPPTVEQAKKRPDVPGEREKTAGVVGRGNKAPVAPRPVKPPLPSPTAGAFRVYPGQHWATLTGTGQARAVFAPGGRYLATASQVSLKLWDLVERKELATIASEPMRRTSRHNELFAVFSPDGKTIASATKQPGKATTIGLWDVVTGERRLTLLEPGSGAFPALAARAPDPAIHELAFSPDGKTLAAAYRAKTYDPESIITLWDTQTGKEVGKLKGGKLPDRLVFSPDGRWLFCGAADGTITRHDLSGKSPPLDRKFHTGPIVLRFSPDGKSLISLGPDAGGSFLKRWSVEPEFQVQKSVPGFRAVHDIIFWDDGKTLASLVPAGKDFFPRQELVLSDAETGQKIESINLMGLNALSFEQISPDRKNVAKYGEDKDRTYGVQLWDLRPVLDVVQAPRAEVAQEVTVQSLAFSPDGRVLATCGWGVPAAMKTSKPAKKTPAFVHFWDVASGKPHVQRHTIPNGAFFFLTFSPDGKQLAVTAREEKLEGVRLFEVPSGKPADFLPVRKSGTYMLGRDFKAIFAPDGNTLAVQSLATEKLVYPELLILGKADKRAVGKRTKPPLAFSPDGKTLASAIDDSHLIATAVGQGIALFDIQTGASRTLTNRDGPEDRQPLLLRWRDSKTLICVHDTGVAEWDTDSGQPRSFVQHGFHGRYGDIWGIDLSADGKVIARGDLNGEITLWERETGKLLKTLRAHKQLVRMLAFSPDGRTLASVGGQGEERVVKLWDVAEVLRPNPTAAGAP